MSSEQFQAAKKEVKQMLAETEAAQSPDSSAKLQRSRARIERTENRIRVVYRARSWSDGAFLVFWLAGWTCFCVAIAIKLIDKPAPQSILMAIPFWSAWLLVFYWMARKLFQKEELIVDGDGLSYRRWLLGRLVTRRMAPLRELRGSKSYENPYVRRSSLRSKTGMEVFLLGRDLRCLKDLPIDELRWLEAELNCFLLKLRPGLKGSRRFAEAFYGDAAPKSRKRKRSNRQIGKQQLKNWSPSDNSWTLIDDIDEFRFLRWGKLPTETLPMLLFLNAFWNSLVILAALTLFGILPAKNPPVGLAWWALLALITLFTVAGLLMLMTLALAVFEPLHETLWTVGRNSISHRHGWLGWGRTRIFRIDRLDRIKMRRYADSNQNGRIIVWLRNFFVDEGSFSLHFFDRSGHECCQIAGLTEGEARWMRQRIEDKRGEWF